MKKDIKLEEYKMEYLNIEIPESARERLMETIEKAKKEKRRLKVKRRMQWTGAVAAAGFAFLIILPNTNQAVAKAMEEIPVIGRIVNVVTFGRYEFKDEYHESNIEIPQIVTSETDSESDISSVNDEIIDYTSVLKEQFKKDVEENGEGYEGLDITYDVVTDNQNWFTLRINVLEVKASGYEYEKYYHIDKRTGKQVTLSDLFAKDSDYKTIISDNIKEQMREQMKDENLIYFLDDMEYPDSNFKSIKADQNFYWDDKGELVIAFDEYEVAPGYMGKVQFTIPSEVIKDLLVLQD